MAFNIWILAPTQAEADLLKTHLQDPAGNPPPGLEVQAFASMEAMLSAPGTPQLLQADLGAADCHEAVEAMRARHPGLRVNFLQKIPEKLPSSLSRAEFVKQAADALGQTLVRRSLSRN